MSPFKNPWAKGGDLASDFIYNAKDELFDNTDTILGKETVEDNVLSETSEEQIPEIYKTYPFLLTGTYLYLYTFYNKSSSDSETFQRAAWQIRKTRTEEISGSDKIKAAPVISGDEIIQSIDNQKTNSIVELYLYGHGDPFGVLFKEDYPQAPEGEAQTKVKRNLYVNDIWRALQLTEIDSKTGIKPDIEQSLSYTKTIYDIDYDKFHCNAIVWFAPCGCGGTPWPYDNPVCNYTFASFKEYMATQGFDTSNFIAEDEEIFNTIFDQGDYIKRLPDEDKMDTLSNETDFYFNVCQEMSKLLYENDKTCSAVIGSYGSSKPGDNNDYNTAYKIIYHNGMCIGYIEPGKPIDKAAIYKLINVYDDTE